MGAFKHAYTYFFLSLLSPHKSLDPSFLSQRTLKKLNASVYRTHYFLSTYRTLIPPKSPTLRTISIEWDEEQIKLLDVYGKQRACLPIKMWSWSPLLYILHQNLSWGVADLSTMPERESSSRKPAHWVHDLDNRATEFSTGVRRLWRYCYVFQVRRRNSRYLEIR